MKRHYHVAQLFTAGSVAMLVMTGCQSEPQELPDVSVNVPKQFEDGGIEWKRQIAVQQADNDCLAEFFGQNEDLAGSPEFEGPPTVFLSGKNDRRFYWMQASVNGGRWRCVEFRKRRFSTTDGLGSPFE